MNTKKEYIKDNLEIINEMISKNTPKFEISRILGVKYQTLNKYLKEFGIDYKGNPSRKGFHRLNERIPIHEYLSDDGKIISASKLRIKLIEEGIKEEKCENCQRTEWMGCKIPLELHHINGNHYDNRLENLQILCSNCHSIIHNYSNVNEKKNIINKTLLKKVLNKETQTAPQEKKQKLKKEKIKRFCIKCGNELKKGQTKYCSKDCYIEDNIKRPSYDELKYKINELNHNLTQIGKFYGVSDVAVKKWIKLYGL